MSEKLIHPSPKQAIKLKNTNCAYCNAQLMKGESTEEHIVGRRFVPKGTLFGQWNVIVYVCANCNNRKSELEDDISAISMQPDAHGQFASEDERAKFEALRKASRSLSRFTGKPVGESSHKFSLAGKTNSGVSVSFEMSGPPQVTQERIYQLAGYHIQGFFFFITFDKQSQLGGFLPGVFEPVMVTRRADWGNAKMQIFASLKLSWLSRFEGIAADEYFKVSIRRRPSGTEVWAWALEWNQNFRIIGFFGSETEVKRELAALPNLKSTVVGTQGNTVYRMRFDVALAPEEDCLFSPPTE